MNMELNLNTELVLCEIDSSVVKARFVRVDDAQFILNLRTDPELNKHISKTETDLDAQKHWIENYLKRELSGSEYYFLITHNEQRAGTVRLYNIDEFSCTSGSWLFSKGVHSLVPLLADSLAYEYCFKVLKKQSVKFDVRLNNRKVINYHRFKQLTVLGRDEQNEYYSMTQADWLVSKKRIEELLGFRLDIRMDNSELLITVFGDI